MEKPSKKRIFIVDDEEGILQLYKEELTEDGYDVFTANSGEDLIGKIKKFSPNLIVLDIKIGGYNGLDLLQDIRETFYNLPVILCSAYSTFKSDLKSIAADSYVVKSSDLTELKKKISRYLEAEVPSLNK
jgi:two-component system response regulator (stage 0 sporulation protein F)